MTLRTYENVHHPSELAEVEPSFLHRGVTIRQSVYRSLVCCVIGVERRLSERKELSEIKSSSRQPERITVQCGSGALEGSVDRV